MSVDRPQRGERGGQLGVGLEGEWVALGPIERDGRDQPVDSTSRTSAVSIRGHHIEAPPRPSATACPVIAEAPVNRATPTSPADLLRGDQVVARGEPRRPRAPRPVIAAVAVTLDRGAHDVGVGGVAGERRHGHALSRRSAGNRAGQADQAMLGGAIGGDPGRTLQPGGRGDIDERAGLAAIIDDSTCWMQRAVR